MGARPFSLKISGCCSNIKGNHPLEEPQVDIVSLTDKYVHEAARVFAESWRAAYRGIVPQSYLDELGPDKWEGRLSADPSNGITDFIVLEDGRCVGILSAAAARDEDNGRCGEIIAIYLLPEYFGKGYGGALLRHGIEFLKGQGYSEACLWVLEDNSRARSFYERNGFLDTAQRMTIKIGGKELRVAKYRTRLSLKK